MRWVTDGHRTSLVHIPLKSKQGTLHAREQGTRKTGIEEEEWKKWKKTIRVKGHGETRTWGRDMVLRCCLVGCAQLSSMAVAFPVVQNLQTNL